MNTAPDYLIGDREPVNLPDERPAPEESQRVWAAALWAVALAAVLLLSARACDWSGEDGLETAYDRIAANPIDEFAGLPPQDVYAKASR